MARSVVQLIGLGGSGKLVGLANPSQFVGYRGNPSEPRAVLLKHNGLHVEIQIDDRHYIGRADMAGVADVLLEAAITTIVDLEDSIAAVDPADKVSAYRNWLELMKGTLTADFVKAGQPMTRRLHPDRAYAKPDGGGELTLRPEPAAGAQCRTPNDGHIGAGSRRNPCA